MNVTFTRMWLTQLAQKCNFSVIPNYHGSTLAGETTLGIVVDNKDNALSIGARLLNTDGFRHSEKLIELLKDAYIDTVPEPERNVEYRIIYFPCLIEGV